MKLKKIIVENVNAGAWVGNIPDMGDLRIHTKGLNNPGFRRLQQTLVAAVPRSERHQGRLAPHTMDEINATCLHAQALIGWENLQDEHGKPVPYSRETAKELLTDPAYRPFFDAVMYAAATVGEDDAEANAADEGNSQAA